MTDEPTFPADAFGKGPETMTPSANATPERKAPTAAPSDQDRTAVDDEGEAPASTTANAAKGRAWPAAGVAIGIGSAAIAAALLYRSRR